MLKPVSVLSTLPTEIPTFTRIGAQPTMMNEHHFQDLFAEGEAFEDYSPLCVANTDLQYQDSVSDRMAGIRNRSNEDHPKHATTHTGSTLSNGSRNRQEGVPSTLSKYPSLKSHNTDPKSLEDAPSQYNNHLSQAQHSILVKIESIIATIIDGLLNDEPISIPIRTRAQKHANGSTRLKATKESPSQARFAYPGSTIREALRFS